MKTVSIGGEDFRIQEAVIVVGADGKALSSTPSQHAEPGVYNTTDAYADVPGTQIDTALNGEKTFGASITETGGVNGATFQIQGSLDGQHWYSIKPFAPDGTHEASVDITVAASAEKTRLLTPDASGTGALRYYKVQAKSTVGGASAAVTASVLAK